jgi:circadian clock protein KaiB
MQEIKNLPNDYILKLYITGASPNSAKAISNIKKICDEHLQNGYKLEIIDIYQQPGIARKEEIVALPLLVKSSPLPVKRLIGNMSDTKKVLKGLELPDFNEE